MPDYLRGPLNEAKEQEWGWSCICDVSKPIGQELTISGAYTMSGDKAQEFTAYFQHALDELGYDIDILYTDTVLFDEEVSKDDKKIKLNPEINVDIPEEDVIFFMSKLRELIIKPQTNKYNANDKLKDIADLYLKHIDKLGGIKYESND